MSDNFWSRFQQTNHLPQLSAAEPSLAAWLERFNSESPTAQELSKFYGALKHQCLLRSLDPDAEPTVSTGTLVRITEYLSGPLLQGSDPQSGRFRGVQLRALVAAFALLHHNGVTTLIAERYDRLRDNIADRFSDIVDGRRATQLEEQIRRAEALYTIRLVAQYFALIKRDQPLPEAWATPIIGLVLAGASIASGQYTGLQSIFRYANHVIGLIPRGQGHFVSLPGIQEVTRNATTLLHSVAVGPHQDDDPEEIRIANDAVQLVLRLLRFHIQDIPSRRNDLWNWPLARLRRSPRSMNKWYFFYGLLDCVGQLAQHVRPDQLPEELLFMIKQLMEESDFEEFRWKIIEIFQAYKPTFANIHQWLRPAQNIPDSDESLASRELDAVMEISRERVSAEFRDDIERNTDRLAYRALIDAQRRRRISRERVPAELENDIERNREQRARADTIEPHPQSDRSMSTSSTNAHERSTSLEERQPQSTPSTSAADFEEYTEGDVEYWPQHGEVHWGELLPSKSRFGRGYAHAGLSADCNLVFFSCSTKVSVFRVNAEGRSGRKEDRLLNLEFKRTCQVADVSLSNTILAVSTRQNLEIHHVEPQERVKTIANGGWDPSGIAIFETDSKVMIAVGQRRSRNGRVALHRFRISARGLLQGELVRHYALPEGCYPKSLVFDPEATTLACITDVRNSVLLWDIWEGAPEDGSPNTVRRGDYRPVRESWAATA
ncbi:MAG: hypothetical protein Q9182_006907 [Xanthomendoza sp. 2 TL-2023]